MSTTLPLLDMVRQVLLHPPGGITGLVDELLRVCGEHRLQLEWQADRCRVRSCEGDWEALTDVALKKSAFRAILARIANLCNEQIPNSVSPYGGQSELTLA